MSRDGYLKTKDEIAAMREGGIILAKVIKKVSENAAPGIALIELDRLASDLTKDGGALPAFLGYRPDGALRPYPATICASLNEVVVHGIPGKRVLVPGDVLKLDFGLRYKGLCVDAAVTLPIGECSAEALKLIEVTREALARAIRELKPGNRLGDVGFAVQNHAEKNNFHVIRGLTGHGVGRVLHEEPVVYNFGRPGKGERLVSGMVLAVEAMIAVGSEHIVQLPDDSYATKHRSLSAQFERTIAVTDEGPRVLTMI